ncbi:Epoxide hydrolase 3 [Lasiodiplodia hormozganensis]|uniref:Epoxide hydrolase 3 n=1 Tax=Lasiodiplodia hormozganensis TaxID=869390 RepID=A0AA40CQL1_9PEZI|nr:Epoxide hydrolase 3 [Lasiodiplodia hormozganensis]
MESKGSTSSSNLARSLWRGFTLSYGLLVGFVWMLSALRDALFFRRRHKKVTEKELAAARDRIWDLSKPPIPNFTHAFFTTPDESPVTLHYVASAWDAGPRPNLVVLLHGFPDSWALWKDFLSQKQNLDRDTVYVALDLPGYGGSDSLAEYNAYNVLEAVTGFVLGMREKYGVDGSGEEGGAVGGAVDERGQVVLVSHDWGGAVACRLASEAPQLADHFVIVSIVLPRLWISNAQARISSARCMCHTWLQKPLNFRLLRSFTGSWFLGKIHSIASTNTPSDGSGRSSIEEAAEALASSLGPGISQCKTTLSIPLPAVPEKQAVNDISTPTAYPSTVHTRATSASHAWFQKTRYYRDGLILGHWSKSLQTILSLSVLDSSNSTLVGSSTGTSPTSSKFASSFSSPPPPPPPTQSSEKTQPAAEQQQQQGEDGVGGFARHRRRRSSVGGLYGSYASRGSRRSSLSVGASLFDSSSGPQGALRAPTTLVAGKDDVAFDWRLALEGIGDHFSKGGAVVVCEGAGHWIVREQVGLEVIRRIVGSVIGAEVVVDGDGGSGSVVVVDGKGVGGGAFGAGAPGAGVGGGGGVKQLLKGVEGVKVTVER